MLAYDLTMTPDSAASPPMSPRAREIVAAARELLEAALISDAFLEAAERFERAADLDELGAAYRAFALEHPHLYRLMFEGRLPRERLVPGAEERAAAPVIAAVGGDPDQARALYAFAHGMVTLELGGRFPDDADLDAAWARGLRAFAT